MSTDCDVAVVGGGLAGSCVAALLARHGRLPPERVALIGAERAVPPAPGDPPRPRVVAISRASERVLRVAQAWQHLPPARLAAYERMRVWHESAGPFSAAALCFDAADAGEPNLGYIAENDLLQLACLDSFADAGGRIVSGRLQALELGSDAARIVLDGTAFTARLVIGADGAGSQVREQAHLALRRHDYRQLALVATVRAHEGHRNTAWQRFLTSGPLALLPLFDGSCSLVWSLPEGEARRLLDSPADAFEVELTRASAQVLGALRLSGGRHSFPLVSQAAVSYVASRCALIGDAAHVIHPLAGQGANLGLLDAAALCEAVAAATLEREDPGALRVLRRYEQQRRTQNLAMASAMEAFARGFALPGPAAAGLIDLGLGAVNRSRVLKRLFARHALGIAGELPELARTGGP